MVKGLRCSFSHHAALFLDLIFFIPPLLDQNSTSFVFGVQSSLGNKRKWVSLPLEEVSRDDDAKTPGRGPARSDTEPIDDSSDLTSPNQTLHNNRAHDSTRSKWPRAHCLLFTSSVFFFLPHFAGLALLFISLVSF